MSPLGRSRFSAPGAVFIVALGRPALAGTGECPAMVVEADEALLGSHPELPGQVSERFAGRDGVDTCATVMLRLNRRAISVEVMLADGRSAERSVTRREDVVPVLEALLLLPPDEAPEPSIQGAPVASRKPFPVRKQVSPQRALRSEREPFPSGAIRANDGWGIELSAVASARYGDDQYSVGLAGLSLLGVAGWLVGFEGRVDSYTSPDEPHAALELGLLTGRRLRFGSLSLDFLAGPALAWQGESSHVVMGPAGTHTETTSRLVPRLVLASHLNFAARSVLRGFVGIEGELGPVEDAGDSHFGPPPLPVWMVGLALGGTVGTR